MNEEGIEIVSIVLNLNNRNQSSRFKRIRRKLRKTWSIGILGALNGLRLRNFYKMDFSNLEHQTLKNFSSSNTIPCHVVSGINTPETRMLFENSHADLGLSLGNSFIGEKVFSIPKLGMINIHHEVLPEYAGAQSVIWQLYNKSKFTGYSIHRIAKSIDKGDILLKEVIPIVFYEGFEETVNTNYNRIVEKSGEGLLKLLKNFYAYLELAEVQTNTKSYTTPTFKQFSQMKRNFGLLKG